MIKINCSLISNSIVNRLSDILSKKSIGFTFYRNNTVIGHNWIRLAKCLEFNTERIETRIELDLSSYGATRDKSRITRQAFIIQKDGIPMRYNSVGIGGQVNVATKDLQHASICIHNKNIEVDIRDCSFILESNFVGLEWLFMTPLVKSVNEVDTWFFDVNSLQRLPYKAKKVEKKKWVTNLGCHLCLDQDNIINEFYYKSLDLSIKLEKLSEPKWDQDIIYNSPTFKYEIPSDAKFYCKDVVFNFNGIEIGGIFRIPIKYDLTHNPLPALLFISGSGTQDRHGFTKDIDLSTHVILDYIANQGFVVLSVDDRELINSKEKKIMELRLSDIIDDFKQSLDSLLSFEPYVNKSKIFLLGHSEGAIISMILAKIYDLAGIILMAPPGRSLDKIIIEQTENALLHAKYKEEQINAHLAYVNRILSHVGNARSTDEMPISELRAQRSLIWLKEHLLNPPEVLAQDVKCPVVIFFGDKDFQLSPLRDGSYLYKKLKESGNEAVSFILLHNVDHLFKVEEGISNPNRYFEERPISEEFLLKVVHWMRSILSNQNMQKDEYRSIR